MTIADLKLENFPSGPAHHPCLDKECKKVFALQTELEHHCKIHHSDIPFTCHFCDLHIPSSALNLINHEREHSNSLQKLDQDDPRVQERGKFTCGRCGASLTSKMNFTHHYLEAHLALSPLDARCPICGMMFQGQEEVPLNHYVNYHDLHRLADPTTAWHCQDLNCRAYYLTEDQLHVHWNKVHRMRSSSKGKQATSRGNYKYPHCPKSFSFLNELQRHNFWSHGDSVKKKSKHSNSYQRLVVSFPEDGITIKDILTQARATLTCGVDNCPSRFEAEADLHHHSKLHGQFKCSFCDVVKLYAPELAIHETVQANGVEFKSGNKSFCCPRCPFSTARRWDYVAHHVETHLGLIVDKIRCPLWKMAYRYGITVTNSEERKIGIWRHFSNFHGDKGSHGGNVIKCEYEGCQAYFLKPDQIRVHTLEVHDNIICPMAELLKCTDCGKRFATREVRRRHRIDVHKLREEDLKFVCGVPACGRRYEDENSLNGHVSQAHGRGTEQLECPEENCKKKCWTKGVFSKHWRTVHQKQNANDKKVKHPFVCEECGKSFKLKCHWQAHMQRHAGPDSWDLECSVCQKKMFSKTKLEEHLRVHTKEKPFVCQVYGVAYAHRHNLRIHGNNKHPEVPDKARKVNSVQRASGKRGKSCRACRDWSLVSEALLPKKKEYLSKYRVKEINKLA